MKILFLANNNLDPSSGGIERTTYNIIKFLATTSKYDITACFSSIPNKIPSVFSIERIVQGGEDIDRIITDSKIEIAIFPGGAWYTNELKSFNPTTKCKIITCLHSPPKVGEDIYLREQINNYHNQSFKEKAVQFPRLLYNIISFPLYVSNVRKAYKNGYANSDAYVLLSQSFFKDFKTYAKLHDDSKLYAIGNALSFDYILAEEEISNKENSVLTVARFHELHKRISLILKVWQRLPIIAEWTLDLVGFGQDEKLYKAYARKNKLENVIFHGRQIPNEFYKKAKIFLMTSKFEGWGMTLTEALQSGCVPVVMDSFGALHDIISHGYNGIIVENNNVDKMAEEVQMLMDDKEKWRQMSLNALESSKNFTIDKIGSKWERLFEEIT